MFSRICRRTLFACSQKVLPFSRISTLDLWSLATEGTQEFPPLNKYQILHVPIFVAMRQCELQTRVCLLLPNCKFGRTKEKNVRLQPMGRKNSPEPRVTDAGRRLRSVIVGRNELRHKTPSATSTLKECPNCNS